MTAKGTSRVVLNRAMFDALTVMEADALFEVGQRVLEVVHVPDAEPYGQGLTEGGGVIAYIGNRKVAGTTIGGKQIKKPRDFRIPTGETAAAVGFGFPGRFVELGTLHTPAEPFLTPAVMQVAGSDAEVIISKSINRRLAGLRDPRAAARFGAPK